MAKKVTNKLFKTNIMNLIVSQGFMNEMEAISMIRQGRIKINNKIYFDPNHGISSKTLFPRSLIQIDANKFYYHPYLYILYNKPQRIVSSSLIENDNDDNNNNVFPDHFLNRSSKLKPLLPLPSNMSGITMYTDDTLLISHVQKNRHLINNHVFEVEFIHNDQSHDNDDDHQFKLHYTDWNYLINSKEKLLNDGMDIHATKNKKRFTNVSISKMECIDDNFKNNKKMINNNNKKIRISKWQITMDLYPRSIYRLLRSINLSPYYIDRISICDKIFKNKLNDNDWRIMSDKEIDRVFFQL